MAKLEFDVSVKDAGLKELNKLIREQTQLTTELVMQHGKEADVAKKAGLALQQLKNDKREVVKATNELSGGLKRSSAQLLEMGENITVVVMGFKSAISGIKNTVSSFTKAANDLQGATLGLESISKFKGIDTQTAVNTVQNMDLIKNGLLTIGDASLAVKNLLATGFTLEQSIDLVKRFGDAAAFGRQSSLEFGYAITSATEGLKNQNSILVDNAGVTKNISVIMKEGGMRMEDLSDATTKQAALQVLYNGILKETQGQLGDAEKLTKTFQGEQAKLNAQVLTLKQNFGLLVQDGLRPVMSVLTDMPPTLQAVSYGFGTLLSTSLDLIAPIAILAKLFPAIGSAMLTVSTTTGIIAAGFANIAAHVNNVIGLFDIFTLKIFENYKQSWAWKNLWGGMIGDSEPQKNTETGFYEGIKNNIKTISDLRKKVFDAFAPLPSAPQIKTGKNGKSPQLEEIENVTEAIEEQSRAIKRLAEDYNKLAFQPIYDKKPKASAIGREFAQSPINEEIKFSIEFIAESFREAGSSVSNIFSDLMNVLNLETSSFMGKMVNGFDTVLSIVNMIVNTMNSINAVKGLISTITSIIPGGGAIAGLASGAGNMPIPMLAGGNQRPIVNVVVHSEVEKTKAIKFFDNNFNAYQNYVRENSH